MDNFTAYLVKDSPDSDFSALVSEDTFLELHYDDPMGRPVTVNDALGTALMVIPGIFKLVLGGK